MTLQEIAAQHRAELTKKIPAMLQAEHKWWINTVNETTFPMSNENITENDRCGTACEVPEQLPPHRASMNPVFVNFKKLFPEASPPTRSHENDAGWDFTYRHVTVELDSYVVNFHTGIAVEIPDGYFGLLRPRSSIRTTRYAVASSGVIDSGYRGEIILPLRMVTEGRDYVPGERVCQLIILPLPKVEFVEVAELGASERGTGGFGSSGTV